MKQTLLIGAFFVLARLRERDRTASDVLGRLMTDAWHKGSQKDLKSRGCLSAGTGGSSPARIFRLTGEPNPGCTALEGVLKTSTFNTGLH